MTVRFFCDVCTNEVEDPGSQREFRTIVTLADPPEGHTASRQVGVKIVRSIDGAWNAGHICNSCLRQAIKTVADRLKTVSAS